MISRNSVFAFKGQSIGSLAISQQLGARYVAEGSIRRAGGRVRADAHLIDCDSAETLLAERFDYDIHDVFDMEDKIARVIVAAIEPELLKRERERAVRSSAHNASAYEFYQQGMWHHYRRTQEDSDKARELFERALRLDPNYWQVEAALAVNLVNAVAARWVQDSKATLDLATAHARAAVDGDPREPMARFALGVACQWQGQREEALSQLTEALRLDPSHAAAHANLGFVYNYLNRPEEALEQVQIALRLSPHDPRRFLWLPALATAHYLSGRYREALAVAQEALTLKPDYPVAVRYLLASLGQLGLREAAAAVLPVMRRIDGSLAGSELILRRLFVEPAMRHVVAGLSKAGFA